MSLWHLTESYFTLHRANSVDLMNNKFRSKLDSFFLWIILELDICHSNESELMLYNWGSNTLLQWFSQKVKV